MQSFFRLAERLKDLGIPYLSKELRYNCLNKSQPVKYKTET
jgi:hypothetical protein